MKGRFKRNNEKQRKRQSERERERQVKFSFSFSTNRHIEKETALWRWHDAPHGGQYIVFSNALVWVKYRTVMYKLHEVIMLVNYQKKK